MTDEEFVKKLEGRSYESFAQLKQEANQVAVEDVAAFPPHFDMRTYLDAAVLRGWIFRTEKGIEVKVDKQQRIGS